jgi:hypothetical protein
MEVVATGEPGPSGCTISTDQVAVCWHEWAVPGEHVVGQCDQSLLAVAGVVAHDVLCMLRVAGKDRIGDLAVLSE